MAFQELIMKIFSDHIEFNRLSDSINSLSCDRAFCLAALKIRTCNAGTGHGINFSNACCNTVVCTNQYYPFGTVFVKGFKLVFEVFTNKKYMPEDTTSKTVIERLLVFLSDKKSKEFLLKLKILKRKNILCNETSLTVALAEHLLSKLSRRTDYILDQTNRRKNGDICKCGCGTLVYNKFADISFGNTSAWHGYLDLLIGGEELPVVICEPGDRDSPGGKLPVEIKDQSEIIESDISTVKQQVLAETIVFSFYQKKKQPKSKHFLIPCLGLTSQSVMIFFYDSEHDILLQSTEINLITIDGKINYAAIIAIWMVVNYKDLCTGLTDDMLKAQKSDFFKIVGDNIDVYRDDISLGNVHGSDSEPKFNPATEPGVPFVWPSNIPKYEIPKDLRL